MNCTRPVLAQDRQISLMDRGGGNQFLAAANKVLEIDSRWDKDLVNLWVHLWWGDYPPVIWPV